MKSLQNMLMTTIQRKNKLYKRASEEIHNMFFKGILGLEVELTEVGCDLFHTTAELWRLAVEVGTAELGEQRNLGPLEVAILVGVEGAEWEKLHRKFEEMNREINVRNPGGSNRA